MHYYVLYKVLHMKEKNVHTFFLLAKKLRYVCEMRQNIHLRAGKARENISILLSKRVTMIVKFHEKVSLTFKWVKEGRKN